ncbi:DUF2750 domain-containing protein [Heyndrickxia coagulans]|uniref:DUF2750 domain-containing protein n=1 Tax=Heyndrickxia coagulans TaxID=1398 RepID=UPI0028F78609|nr:DUF2750 domain-containing protein [Heyndrickxia coagulans]MDT9757074.1 DUF2750 domain-containing protein [Heyndrickxia coagulans]
MNSKEVEAVLTLQAFKRYEYFIKKSVDYEEVWGLYHDGWAMSKDDNGCPLVNFWPKKEFAQKCAVEEWKEYHAKKIDLYEFMNEWLPGMKSDGIKPSIFWNNVDSVVVDTERLKKDLDEKLENY